VTAPPRGRRGGPPRGGTAGRPPRTGTAAGRRAAGSGRGAADRPIPRRERPRVGGDQVEGRQAVRALLAGRRPVRELWIAEGLDPSPQLDEIERLAARRRIRIRPVPKRRLDAAAASDAPQGVLALAEPLPDTDLDDLVLSAGGRPPFLVVLDGITDPHNVGSIFRTADGAGVTGIVLPSHRAVHVTPTVAKVAAGAIEHVPVAVVPGVPAALRRLDDLGVPTVGLDADADISLYDLGPVASGPVALVLGAEGRGLAALTRRRCTTLAAIPLAGRLESLNVAAAAAVACFELARRRAGAPPDR